jgi:hypothetical protein
MAAGRICTNGSVEAQIANLSFSTLDEPAVATATEEMMRAQIACLESPAE